MGFVLTLLYIVLTIISPEQFGQAWASYHPMVYLAGITVLASLPSVLTHKHLRSSIQTFLMLGFILAVALSQIVNGWLGGAFASWRVFLPSAAIFFFTVANVNTIRRLKIIVLTTVATCLALAAESLSGYYGGFGGDMFVFLQNGQIPRLRALGFLNDPNDLAQILLIALSLIFIRWNRGRVIANSFNVLTPLVFLVWAIYLTHSRGALIALGILILVACQRKMGKGASAVLAGVLVSGMMALDFTGGRGISAAEGADRLEAWATGLELFKRAPLFGIGFGRFTDFNDITAHNSFILCLAELGLVGSTIWVALLVTTLLSLTDVIKSQEQLLAMPNAAGDLEPEAQATLSDWEPSSCSPLAVTLTKPARDVGTEAEVGHRYIVLKPFAVVMLLALISFITTSMFLSRSYVQTMYLILGVAVATIAIGRPTCESGDRHRWVFVTLVVEGLAIIFIYCAVCLRH